MKNDNDTSLCDYDTAQAPTKTKDNQDNETQSEIATIREHGSLRYGASAYDNVELLNQRSALNSLNSEASAEVLNQRAETSDLNP